MYIFPSNEILYSSKDKPTIVIYLKMDQSWRKKASGRTIHTGNFLKKNHEQAEPNNTLI